jgi:hypothetical protein
MSAESGPPPRPRWLAPLAAGLAGFLAWRVALGWALLGWDSYPMIHAGAIRDAESFLGTFTEELMDGRYPLGHFWRPVVHFAFALDHALWGLDPFGYHLSDLCVLAISAALVALLAERWLGAGGWPLAGLAAGLAFAWHPLHFEVLPVAPRRADGLAVLFTLVALHAALSALRGSARPGAWAWISAAAAALALAAKETGVVAAAAVALLALSAPLPAPGAERRGERLGHRAARAARTLWPVPLALAPTFALRTWSLGGLGGGQASSLWTGFAHAPSFARLYARALFFPSPPWSLGSGETAPVALAISGALALSVLCALRGGPRAGGIVLALCLWALLLLPLTGMSALDQGWYAFPYLPVVALGAGLAAATAQRAARARRPATAVPAGTAASALVLTGLLGSPLLEDSSDFELASRLERDFLVRFEQRLADAVPGRTYVLRDCPAWIQRVRDRATGEQRTFVGTDRELSAKSQGLEPGRMIYMLAGYSLEAFADLELGDGRVRVSMPGMPPSPRAPAPDVIDVTVTALPLGFLDPGR